MIYEALRRAEVVITVIGPAWSTMVDEHGARRLDNPEDFVRQELGFALGATLPTESQASPTSRPNGSTTTPKCGSDRCPKHCWGTS